MTKPPLVAARDFVLDGTPYQAGQEIPADAPQGYVSSALKRGFVVPGAGTPSAPKRRPKTAVAPSPAALPDDPPPAAHAAADPPETDAPDPPVGETVG